MPIFTVSDVGSIGIVQDVPAYELPPNAWTAGQNVRMQDGSVHKAYGYESFWSEPEVDPYIVLPWQTPTAYFWVYLGLAKAFAVQNQYHFDITRASGDYAASPFRKWTWTNLGGVLVANNQVDVPQYWTFPVSQANLLQDLTAWPSTDRAGVIRAYKNFLVAINITRSGVHYPTMVKWSHGADIGSIPSSWAINDPTLDGGEDPVPGEGGDLIDQRVLRDSNILYRSDATWGMQFIGAPQIFRFYPIFETSGILATECVQEFFGQHFCVTADDLIVHDGQGVQRPADHKVRRAFFADIDATYYDRTFVVHNKADKEMWVCYPQSGSTSCDKGLVWSYDDGTWAFRDLPDLTSAAFGVADSTASDTWDTGLGSWNSWPNGSWASASASWTIADSATWASDTVPWDYRTYDAQRLDLIASAPSVSKLYKLDTTNTNDDVVMTSYIERTGLTLVDSSRYSRKTVRAVFPHIEGTAGGVVNVYVGYQNSIGDTVKWSAAKTYTIGTDYKCDFQVDGRFIAVKFESTTDVYWRLHSYEIDFEVSSAK